MFKRWLVGVVAAGALASGAGLAAAFTQVSVKRCGYTHVDFPGVDFPGRVAYYPWHLSCATARTVLHESVAPRAKTIGFTADGANTGDSGAVRINGRWWVCGGRMGSYFCGYPYRPARVGGIGGGTTFKGPFTEQIGYYACADAPGMCKARETVWLPSAKPL